MATNGATEKEARKDKELRRGKVESTVSFFEIDIEKSLSVRNLPVMFTRSGNIVARESDRLKSFVYQLKLEHSAKRVIFVPDEEFDLLREQVLTATTGDIESVMEDVLTETTDEEDALDDTEVARQLELIFASAARLGASDIHIVPFDKETKIEFRIDGYLVPFKSYPKNYARFLVNKIKMLASMNVTNSLVPQDGKMKIRVNDTYYEYRVSTCPTVHGEDAVLRVQKVLNLLDLSLDTIGFEPADLEAYRQAFAVPTGLIINAGGTGEGKTTTLYLTLMELIKKHGSSKRVLTVEDPVEVFLPGVVQVEVNEKQNRTFAQVLRSFLRHDPDIILVGEIRDEETARIAARAALTGHLVLTTVHAVDSFNAVTRLQDLGFPALVLASVTSAILSQRLVRKLCPHCKEKKKLPPQVVRKYRLDFTEAYFPVGCPHCNNTGYAGRTAVFELLIFTPEMKEMVSQGAPETAMKKLASDAGFRNLWHNALLKVKAGITSLEEVEGKIKPDPLLNGVGPVAQRREVDLGIVFYPDRKIPVSLAGVQGHLFDISHTGMSVIFDEPKMFDIDVPVEGYVATDNRIMPFTFIPKSFRKLAKSGRFIVGGLYRGSLEDLILKG